ncbi:hypothetical protein QWV57_05480 [Geobacillus zalihae]|uniref:hypothetical protein n=1 Tax=Geobacillus zalihae TaxID=213419 RepID=UPI002605EFFC|nr:hypothetical protein [Geobacillus zalihae]WKA48415.1 hypothetical protein QWV57_05480 [Geobacillus zalihae]
MAIDRLSPRFVIGSIHIGTVEGASCVNFGNNFVGGFTSHIKQNQGFGSITGDHNDIHDLLSRLDEQGVFEMFQPPSGEDGRSIEAALAENGLLIDDSDIEDSEFPS